MLAGEGLVGLGRVAAEDGERRLLLVIAAIGGERRGNTEEGGHRGSHGEMVEEEREFHRGSS